MGLMNDAPATLWVADADTGSFTFHAWGRTPQEAADNLAKGLRKHARQYSLSKSWVEQSIEEAWYMQIPNGGCARDGSAL